jgi:rhodanese-related sulfurtransferase
MLSYITPAEAQKMLQEGKARLVDVREADELSALRVPGAEAAPLSVISWMDIRPANPECPIIFTCRSGNRTTKHSDLLQKLAHGPAFQLEGGITEWAKQGLPVELTKTVMPIFRQIQIGAGALVLAGLLGSAVWHPLIWLSAFVGAGLVFAGMTGFCGLGIVLAAMPWNKK